MGLTFTERQAAAVATAVTILAAMVILFAVGSVFWLLALFVRTFSGVFLPLAVGGIAALVCRPYYAWLTSTVRLPRTAAVAVVILSIVVPIVAFFAFFGTVLVRQLLDLLSRIPDWWQGVSTTMRDRWPELREFLSTPLGAKIQQAAVGLQDEIVSGLEVFGGKALAAGAGMVRGVGSVLNWAVVPVYFVFFLMTKPAPIDSAQILPFLKSETRNDIMYLIHAFVDIVVAFFRGQLIIALLQGLLFAVGFSLVGLRYGFIIGIVLGLLNVIPYLGSIIGLGVSLPLAFFQYGGGWGTLIGVLSVFLVVQLIEGYVLTPRIMGERTGLHPMAIIIAIFFWGTALGGILGMILAIPLTAFLASLWRMVKEKYITELV
jgi:predicted PurR-regulated permease PerM